MVVCKEKKRQRREGGERGGGGGGGGGGELSHFGSSVCTFALGACAGFWRGWVAGGCLGAVTPKQPWLCGEAVRPDTESPEETMSLQQLMSRGRGDGRLPFLWGPRRLPRPHAVAVQR